MSQSLSVCTLVRNRTAHLKNVLAGLSNQTAPADDIVIVWMQPELDNVGTTDLPLRHVTVASQALPLAEARNAAAEAASGDLLVFVDVDCVPAPGLCGAYRHVLSENPAACVMGTTRYLTAGVPVAGQPFEALWDHAVQHPARIDPDATDSAVQSIPDHAEFWSLSFALAKETFARTGGFDARFNGYGGEDTDFAMRLRACGVPLMWSGDARAVHQWHRVSIPPVQHFDDIIANARLFHRIHGSWPMTYWLDQFERAGWVHRTTAELTVLRRPGPRDIRAALQPDNVAFS
ncbi:MAG: galactosyltransferase-related protein [Pseudomonadota bacterium]